MILLIIAMQSYSPISERYLKKLKFQKRVSLTLECLREILILHIQSIPFGNLNAFLGKEISLDLEEIANKLLDDSREGYCFEHNILTRHVLNELGFEAFNLLGRVYYQNKHITTPPKTHLVTIVKLDGELFLFDPGFGGMTPTGILSLSQINKTQETPYESFRLIDVKDSGVNQAALYGMKIMLQAYVKNNWINMYAFDPENQVVESDLMVANWYVSTSPKSLFTQNLVFSTIHDNQRKTINNNVMKLYSKNNVLQKDLRNVEDYKKCFQEIFNLNISTNDLFLLSKKLEIS